MLREDTMSVDERRKYLKLVAPRYARARRPERSAMLTEMAAVTGLHRKS
ncbi:MAG: integrase, partial [Chloroflexi bacterium]|nr:integrase [Chloroflexota bacterium]